MTRLLLVLPRASFVIKGVPRVFQPFGPDRTVSATIGYLAARLRRHAEVDVFCEDFEPYGSLPSLPCERYDAVAVTANVCTAHRAYQIGDLFRGRGKTVIMGGIHPSVMPEEALGHCDCVVAGEAEDLVAGMCQDLSAGRLARVYRCGPKPDLKGIFCPDYSYFVDKFSPYGRRTFFLPVETSRGCVHACAFCSVKRFHETTRFRPVEEVVSEIRELKERHGMSLFSFVDNDLLLDRARTEELLRRLVPLKIRWGSFWSASVAEHLDLAGLAAASGCVFAAVGFESIDPAALRFLGKGAGRRSREEVLDAYTAIIAAFHRHGITTQANLVWVPDLEPSIERSAEFFHSRSVGFLVPAPLVPLPNAPLYRHFESNGMLKSERWWLAEDYARVVPVRWKTLSTKDVMNLTLSCLEDYHGFWRTLRRIAAAGANRRLRFLLVELTSLLSCWARRRLRLRSLDRFDP